MGGYVGYDGGGVTASLGGTPAWPASLEHHLVHTLEWQHMGGRGHCPNGGGGYAAERFSKCDGARYLLDKATLGPQKAKELGWAEPVVKKNIPG